MYNTVAHSSLVLYKKIPLLNSQPKCFVCTLTCFVMIPVIVGEITPGTAPIILLNPVSNPAYLGAKSRYDNKYDPVNPKSLHIAITTINPTAVYLSVQCNCVIAIAAIAGMIVPGKANRYLSVIR